MLCNTLDFFANFKGLFRHFSKCHTWNFKVPIASVTVTSEAWTSRANVTMWWSYGRNCTVSTYMMISSSLGLPNITSVAVGIFLQLIVRPLINYVQWDIMFSHCWSGFVEIVHIQCPEGGYNARGIIGDDKQSLFVEIVCVQLQFPHMPWPWWYYGCDIVDASDIVYIHSDYIQHAFTWCWLGHECTYLTAFCGKLLPKVVGSHRRYVKEGARMVMTALDGMLADAPRSFWSAKLSADIDTSSCL
jgi:hypothetical protein